MSFKFISIFGSGDHFVQLNRTVCAILVQGVIRNIYVHLFWILVSGYWEDVVIRFLF